MNEILQELNLGLEHYFETLVGYSDNSEFDDLDVTKLIKVPLNTRIEFEWKELESDLMHESVVNYIIKNFKEYER